MQWNSYRRCTCCYTSDDSEIEKVIVDGCARNRTPHIVGEHFFIGAIDFVQNAEDLIV